MRCALLEDGDLMTQSKDFDLLCGAGPECRGEHSQKGDENRAHCGNDDDLTNGRNPCRLSPDRIFGRNRPHRSSVVRLIGQCDSDAGDGFGCGALTV